MFCPNCGRKCADGKFCPSCGTKLPWEEERPVLVAESKPQTNHAEPVPDSAELPKRTNTRKGTVEIPTSRGYLGKNGVAILLSDADVTVSCPWSRERTVIPFHELEAVIYLRPAYNGWDSGALLLRGGQNRNVPIPETRKINLDSAAATFSLEQDTLFYHIFQLLKSLAPDTARCEMILPEIKLRNLDQAASMVDLEYFWNMYAPYRERAASGICAKHGIKKDAARAMVDRVFDANQKILYEADPLDAVRDLNLVVGNIRQEEQRTSRQQAQSRKRQEEESLREAVDTIAWLKLRQSRDD